jgi:hypothetical protein
MRSVAHGRCGGVWEVCGGKSQVSSDLFIQHTGSAGKQHPHRPGEGWRRVDMWEKCGKHGRCMEAEKSPN